MQIIKGLGAIALGVLVLSVGLSEKDNYAPMGAIQNGTGKMTVLYDGLESGSIDFGNEAWAPGDMRSITVEIRNEGEIDFISSMNTGDYYSTGYTLVHEMEATISNEAGETLFQGAYPEIEVSGLDIPVGESEELKLSVQWIPSDADLSQKRTGGFAMKVNASQKIG